MQQIRCCRNDLECIQNIVAALCSITPWLQDTKLEHSSPVEGQAYSHRHPNMRSRHTGCCCRLSTGRSCPRFRHTEHISGGSEGRHYRCPGAACRKRRQQLRQVNIIRKDRSRWHLLRSAQLLQARWPVNETAYTYQAMRRASPSSPYACEKV